MQYDDRNFSLFLVISTERTRTCILLRDGGIVAWGTVGMNRESLTVWCLFHRMKYWQRQYCLTQLVPAPTSVRTIRTSTTRATVLPLSAPLSCQFWARAPSSPATETKFANLKLCACCCVNYGSVVKSISGFERSKLERRELAVNMEVVESKYKVRRYE